MAYLETYKETLNSIKKIMRYQKDLIAVFSVGGVEKLRKALGIMESQLNQFNEGKKVTASDADKSRMKEVVDLFLDIAVYRPIVPIFRDLSEVYLLLVFNWNKELGKVPDIETRAKSARNIAQGKMTMEETIGLLKILSVRLQKQYQYEPPTFELSKHYLKSLEGDRK